MASIPPELKKYKMMLKVGLPEMSVRNRMTMDGFDDDVFDQYFSAPAGSGETPPPAPLDETEPSPQDNAGSPPDEAAGGPPAPPQNVEAAVPSTAIVEFDESILDPSAQKIDMKGLEPIPIKKTLLIVNTFLINTVTFTNKFLNMCEQKLSVIQKTIDRLEVQMNLLEGKLGSIDWLRQPSPKPQPVAAPASEPQQEGGEVKAEPLPEAVAEPEELEEDPIKSDPEFKRFLMMLKVGVAAQAVRTRMDADGYDQDIIERVLAFAPKQ